MERFAGLAISQIRYAALAEGRKNQVRKMLDRALGIIADYFKKNVKPEDDGNYLHMFDLGDQSLLARGGDFWNGETNLSYDNYFNFLEDSLYLEKYSIWVTKIYAQSLINQYTKKGKILIRLPEDFSDLAMALEAFDKKKRALPPEQRDINKYKSSADFLRVALPLVDVESKRGKEKRKQLEGADTIFDDDHWKIVKLTTVEATSALTRFKDDNSEDKELTGWCVKDPKWASNYLQDGPIYLIYLNGVKYALAHFPTAQFMNLDDDELSFGEVKEPLDIILKEDGLNALNAKSEKSLDLSELINYSDGDWPTLEGVVTEAWKNKQIEIDFENLKEILRNWRRFARSAWPFAEKLILMGLSNAGKLYLDKDFWTFLEDYSLAAYQLYWPEMLELLPSALANNRTMYFEHPEYWFIMLDRMAKYSNLKDQAQSLFNLILNHVDLFDLIDSADGVTSLLNVLGRQALTLDDKQKRFVDNLLIDYSEKGHAKEIWDDLIRYIEKYHNGRWKEFEEKIIEPTLDSALEDPGKYLKYLWISVFGQLLKSYFVDFLNVDEEDFQHVFEWMAEKPEEYSTQWGFVEPGESVDNIIRLIKSKVWEKYE